MTDIRITPSPHGRWEYVPSGGCVLTAEQVEDVRTVAKRLRHVSFRGGVQPLVISDAIAIIEDLFPATEPAEEAPNLADVAQEPRRFDPADECQNDNHDPGCVCGAQHWMTTPAPAVPAEEETKAEAGDWCVLCYRSGHNHTAHKPQAASPVVPAPTETRSWPTWQAVPEGVKYKSGAKDWVKAVYVNRNGVRMAVVNGEEYPSTTDESKVRGLAPFVSAGEGDA